MATLDPVQIQGGTMEVAKASGEIELRLFLWNEMTRTNSGLTESCQQQEEKEEKHQPVS